MESYAGLTETGVKPKISMTEQQIFDLVSHYWPASAIEIAQHFEENVSSREERRKASTKYIYYLKKLVDKQLLFSKKIGNATIFWPMVVEKYKVIHGILDKKVEGAKDA